MIDNLFLSVLEVSLSSSVVIILLLFLAPFLNKRYAIKWKYRIWIFLALHLVIPISGRNMMSLIEKMTNSITAGVTTDAAEIENKDMNEALAAAPRRIVVEIPSQVNEPFGPAASSDITLLIVLESVWIAGALLFLAAHLGSYGYYKRQILKGCIYVESLEVLRQLSDLCHELQIKDKISVVEYAKAESPMMIGFWHPLLVLPEKEYRQEELFFILKHELVHLKRRDVYWKLLFVAANAVHFFNPVIWRMRKEAVLDMELSCDERVMQGADFAARKAYTETLFSMLHRKQGTGGILTTQFYGGKQVMKKRFRNIIKKTKVRNGGVIWAGIAVLIIGLGIFIGCSVAKPEAADEEGGIVNDGIEVPEVVLGSAKALVSDWYGSAQMQNPDAHYVNWRIEALSYCYTYDDFNGMMLQVYQMNYEFLSDTPENIVLAGGMSVTEDGWVAPDYANSRFLIFGQNGDEISFLICLLENDCMPGDEAFDSDLRYQLEYMGIAEKTEDENTDTAILSYLMEGEVEEEYATLFVGDGFSIYVPDNWSLYAPDAWSYIYNERIQFWVAHFENQTLEKVQADLAVSQNMTTESRVSGKVEMAKQEGETITKVRLMEAADDVWGVFYTYPEEAIEGAGATLPVIADTFAVMNQNDQVWQSRMLRSSFWDFKPDIDMSAGSGFLFVNGLQLILPEEWADNVILEVAYAPGEGNNGDTLTVCEENNAQAGAGGVLFYLHYIDKDYYAFSQEEPYQMFGESIDKVLGVYEQDGHAYALVFELPREMNYVEGDEEMKKVYEDAFALVEQAEIVTDNMENFTECGVDDLDWVIYMD